MPTHAEPRTLTVVIPALDEEEAIGGTIRRCLAARTHIMREADLDEVEIIVVDDGSTDRTAAIAASFDGVKLISFGRNLGYGAAIQEGFRVGRGDLVGFLDADGTCDPMCFAEMARTVAAGEAEIALGSRLGPGSRMPRVRRLGNRIFAGLLGFLCGRWVTDTASGMRVLSRSAWERLQPLPDGLHFTPSMSARALLNGLQVTEIPMPYEERIGRSKLSVARDGLRFLRTIIEGVLCFQPERPFLLGFALCAVVAAALAAYPIEFYLHHRYVEEWMLYRFLGCGLLGSFGYQMLAAAALANRMATLGPRRRGQEPFWSGLLARMFSGRAVCVLAGTMTMISIVLLWPGIVEYVATRQLTLHWSRVMVGGFGLLVATQALVGGVLMQAVELWRAQHRAPRNEARFARRIEPSTSDAGDARAARAA